MNIHESPQGTTEWKQARHGLIGGTTLKDLMSTRKNNFLDTLISEHCEPFTDEESFQSQAMLRGLELEPQARSYASEYLGHDFKEFGLCTIPKLPLNGCSPDGFTEDLKHGIEIKCPSAHVHVKYIRNNEIPPEYFWQCVNYFLINEALETLFFVSYRPENSITPFFFKEIKREEVAEHIEMAFNKSIEINETLKEELEKLQW